MSKRRVLLIAAGLSLLYLVIQVVYISRLPLVMDEFDGAKDSYKLLSLTPYRDYRPYKTVVGYYLQLPPLLLTSDPWTALMLSKAWLALINTAAIFASTIALASIFSPPAALIGQALLIFVTTFLERSSEIRVDMLTAWAGLASFLFLLNRRWAAAGLLAGLSFLVSQKGIYYIVSANAAAGIFWLFESRDRRTFRDLAVLNAVALSTIAGYILLWGMVSSPWTVFSTTFLSHGDIVFANLYDLEHHWTRTLSRNRFFYFGALAGIAGLLAARWRGHAGGVQVMTAVYAAMLFALCRLHKQPWPYFFVLLIPTLVVVHVAVAEIVWRNPRWRWIAAAAVVLFGVVVPLRYMPGILSRSHDYQRNVVRLAGAILDKGDTYLAGNDLVYVHEQAHVRLRRLAAPEREALKQSPPEAIDRLIADLEKVRPKLVIADTRMRSLPQSLRIYLDTRFHPLGLSVNAYAPLVGPDEEQFEVWFDGDYRIESTGEAIVDGIRRETGTVLALQRGSHLNRSASPIRLRLQPPGLADHSNLIGQRSRSMFVGVYDY